MKPIAVLVLVLCFISTHAQTFKKDLDAEEYVSTSDYGVAVPIKKFSLSPYHLLRYDRSIDSNILFLYLEDNEYSQYMICLDVNADSVLYGVHVKHGSNIVEGYKDYYVTYTGKSTNVFSNFSGDLLWAFDGHLMHVDVKNNIGIDDYGKAYDMYSGVEKWRVNIDRTFGVDNIWTPDSNWMMFVANGLQFINTKSGTSWFHRINTGIPGTKEYKALLPDAYYGIDLFQSRRKTMSNANSNIIQSGRWYYFAGIDEIICINMLGEVQWRKRLPANSGFSYLDVRNRTVFLMSTGLSFVNNLPVAYSNAYIAAFDKDNGDLYYYTPLDKNTLLLDYHIDREHIMLTTRSSVRVYDIRTGKLEKKLMLDKYDKEFKQYMSFCSGDKFYTDTTLDSKKSLSKLYSDNFFLMNRVGNILRLNYSLDTYDIIKSSELYYKRAMGNYITITSSLNSKKVYIDKPGKRLFRHGSAPDIQIGEKLLFIEKNAIYIADLSGL